MKKTTTVLIAALLALLVSTASASTSTAAPPDRPGIGEYLCHLFGKQHWEVCKPFPGKGR